jgi:hypothetical protein
LAWRVQQAVQRRKIAKEIKSMNLTWIGRNRSLELSPRARLVDEVAAEALRRKREELQWRPRNGFLVDETRVDGDAHEAADRAA